MGVRGYFDENPRITTGAAAALLLVVFVCIYFELRGPPVAGDPTQTYFTADDGNTWFKDDVKKIAPFDHSGQQAVRCHVFSTPSGKKAIYLEKLTDDARNMATQSQASGGGSNLGILLHNATLVKKPGDKDWLNIGNPAARAVMDAGPDATELYP